MAARLLRRTRSETVKSVKSYSLGVLAGAVFLSLVQGVAPVRAEISGSIDISDGDTFDIGMVRIRLHGIDAPEVGQSCETPAGETWPCGARAAERLADLTRGRDVSCKGQSRDAYGRVIAICVVDGIDIGEILVREGLAWAYLEYSADYIDQEARARSDGQGIWQAETQAAWDFRADKWQRAAAVAPRENCPIKGNISSKGDRIYHTPWSKYYSRTRINTEAGEMWFCDENEAREAGWRPVGDR